MKKAKKMKRFKRLKCKKLFQFSHTMRQMLAPVLCAIFTVCMAMMVKGQMTVYQVALEQKNLYVLFMGVIALGVIALGIWSIVTKAYATGMICALGILATVAASYQVLFSFKDFCMHAWLAVLAGMVVYAIWRRVNYLPNLLFYGLCVICIGVMLLLKIFGKAEQGAVLGIPFPPGSDNLLRPGEIVKFLTMVLGACAYTTPMRKACYSITNLFCCAMFLLCNDLGGAVLLFALFWVMSYMLYDNRILSISIVVIAAAGLFFAIFVLGFADHAKSRLLNWFSAMEQNQQQHTYIRAMLLGGFGGLGLEHSEIMTAQFAARNDGALAGVMAIYGVPVAAVTMSAYALLALTPAYNRSTHPSGYLILVQMSIFVACHCILNLGGALDLLPFTGIVSSVISAGGVALICFGSLMGLCFAALHTTNRSFKEV